LDFNQAKWPFGLFDIDQLAFETLFVFFILELELAVIFDYARWSGDRFTTRDQYQVQ
jgi:hypothetical protein